MWDDVLSWCNSQFFCLQISRWSLRAYYAVAVKSHSSMRIVCLACQGELYVDNPIDVKENDGHALDFALHL
jgi:hypothetical protein